MPAVRASLKAPAGSSRHFLRRRNGSCMSAPLAALTFWYESTWVAFRILPHKCKELNTRSVELFIRPATTYPPRASPPKYFRRMWA